jgi:cytochrome c oxidase subunit 2
MRKTIQSAVLAFAVTVSLAAMPPHPADEPKTIDIAVKRFEFSPSKVTLKRGETVTLRFTSQDVTHGLFVRSLKIDTDIPAGQTKEITITPQAVGVFTAICDHFCGSGHGNMKMTFEVVN